MEVSLFLEKLSKKKQLLLQQQQQKNLKIASTPMPLVLSSIALLSIFLILHINLYAGTASLKDDQLIKMTINHITIGSPLFWIHFLFVVVVILVHFGLYTTFNSVCSWAGFLGILENFESFREINMTLWEHKFWFFFF